MQHKLTEAQKAEIEALAAMPEEAIDISDIPPLDDKFWNKVVHNPFYHSIKLNVRASDRFGRYSLR